jgi:hypothetical protein
MNIERKFDVVTGAADIEHLHTFKDFPVFMGCTTAPRSADVVADMSFWISRGSGMVQLNPLLPLDVLYPEAHGAGCVGALWKTHHEEFANFVFKFKPKRVLEIGGSHGILAANYDKKDKVDWTILEPNPTPVEGCPAKFIKGFFDEKFSSEASFDAVVHSHVFEHIYEPDQFMQHLSGFIEEGKTLIFSIPNLQVMLERKYTNGINFEHTVLLTETYIDYFLAKHGFRIAAKEYFMDDHSIFYAAVRDSTVPAVPLPAGLHAKNQQLYLDYVDYHVELIKEINARIRETDQPVYLFGAHIFTQYLISFGLDVSRIVCILDNDKNKHGKRLYGTAMNVASPAVLRDVDHPVVILKAGVYNDEIRKDILENINGKTVFLE